MTSPGIFAETGRCYYCDERRCECDRDESDESKPSVFQGKNNEWHDGETGRIISELEAKNIKRWARMPEGVEP